MMHMLGQLPNLESLIFSNSRIELLKSREGVIYPRNLRSLEIRGGNIFLESLFVGDLTSFKFTDRGFLDSFEFEGMIKIVAEMESLKHLSLNTRDINWLLDSILSGTNLQIIQFKIWNSVAI